VLQCSTPSRFVEQKYNKYYESRISIQNSCQPHQIRPDQLPLENPKGCDVILVEKEGFCEVLEPYANRRGVALVNSRGFATEYAKQLLDLSEMLQGNLFLLTDYDASGLLIAEKLKDILRLGVDPRMISRLGLSRKRIEIDAILAAVGPEKLWNYLEERMRSML